MTPILPHARWPLLSRVLRVTILLGFVFPLLLPAREDAVQFRQVRDPKIVARMDAMIQASRWLLRKGGPASHPTNEQIRQLLITSNKQRVSDIDVCYAAFSRASRDLSYELLVVTDASGRHFCNFVDIVRRTSRGYDIQSFDSYEVVDSKAIQVDASGKKTRALLLREYWSSYEGARGCQAKWTSVFTRRGDRYVKSDSMFPDFYRQRRDELSVVIAQSQRGAAQSESDFELDSSCDIMERDRIERFLSLDSKAGLDRALVWSASDSEQLRDRSVVILAEIDDPAARQSLQALCRDADVTIADSAHEALFGSSFSLEPEQREITISRGASGQVKVRQFGFGRNRNFVSFSIGDLPDGVKAGFTPVSVGDGKQTTLTLTTTSQAAPGNYQLMITGTDAVDPSYTRSIHMPLTIDAPQTATKTRQ